MNRARNADHVTNMRKVCLFYSQNNKIVYLSNMADTFIEKLTVCFFFLDCALLAQIGWAGMFELLKCNYFVCFRETYIKGLSSCGDCTALRWAVLFLPEASDMDT